jgi:hypothetical protein
VHLAPEVCWGIAPPPRQLNCCCCCCCCCVCQCTCALPQTLIKIITGEHKSSTGTVWRHPNLRMAYVAQHAFHHLEEHLDTTPLKYMFKRFGLGEDKVRGQGGLPNCTPRSTRH